MCGQWGAGAELELLSEKSITTSEAVGAGVGVGAAGGAGGSGRRCGPLVGDSAGESAAIATEAGGERNTLEVGTYSGGVQPAPCREDRTSKREQIT